MDLPRVWTDSVSNTVLVVAEHEKDWVVYARLVPRLNYAVVELRVGPRRGLRIKGNDVAWDFEFLLEAGRVPTSGIAFRRLSDIAYYTLRRHAEQLVDINLAWPSETEGPWSREAALEQRRQLLGLPPEPAPTVRLSAEERHALYARELEALVTQGHTSPQRALGELHGKDANWASQVTYRARHTHKLLEESADVRPGHTAAKLTARGRRVLKRALKKIAEQQTNEEEQG